MAKNKLFHKVACFTDIHFGLKSDSRQHNIDCENFVTWFIEEAKSFGAETCIFLGDWHHNRAKVNVSTLNYSLANIERLGKSFERFYFITGNHDLYYRDKREINSVEFGRNIENVKIVSEPLIEGDVAIIPWLVGDEWKKIKEIKCRYMFGHFELPRFKMNQMVEMPDTGELSLDDLTSPEYVFSGHFHKRQYNNNVYYIGNAFPHNFADEGDDDRGAMFLEWGKEPVFKTWPGAPRYRKAKLSELLERPGNILNENTYARIDIDVNLNYETTNYIREVFEQEYNPRDLTFNPLAEDEVVSDFSSDVLFESVDSVVLEHLKAIESHNIDNELLSQIYRSL